jgi:phosphatidylserine decarboxylase
MLLLVIILSMVAIGVALAIYWRFFYFFRDPDRITPSGDNIVAPADGTIIYIRKVEEGKVPLAIKNRKEIELEEIMKLDPDGKASQRYIMGIFMTPLDVHVNRAPISGKVEQMLYFSGKNFSMARMTFNKILGINPLYSGTGHILQNERNTMLIKGEFPVYVVQIADSYVKKIENWVKEGEVVKKGQRIGIVKMGSQVDVIFPLEPLEIQVREGQHVTAGETILATWAL